MTPDEIFALERENALLREALFEEWEANHTEHCDREWPHPEGKRCHWPLPAILTTTRSAAPYVWERGFAALASLVRQEYPERHSLADIALTWGESTSPEQIEALRVIEACDASARSDA